MIVKLLTEHYLEFLSLKEGCRGSSESTLVKTSNCWKSHAAAQIILTLFDRFSGYWGGWRTNCFAVCARSLNSMITL